jgi:hypothetical protein
MNYRERSSHADDYIDRASDGFGWKPIVLVGIVFIALLALLVFVPSGRSVGAPGRQAITSGVKSARPLLHPRARCSQTLTLSSYDPEL